MTQSTWPGPRAWAAPCVVLIALLLTVASVRSDPQTTTLSLRGRAQILHLYGPDNGPPVIVSSGDGGWIHLGPHVAEQLAGRGYFVVGFDVRAYLAGFTTDTSTLRVEDVPGDYRRLIEFAQRGTRTGVLLAGVSEGAGLSVLAATDRANKPQIRGVVTLGLGDANELGWRWKDAVIYITKGVPHEPLFRASELVSCVAPVPLAAIQSTHDEFVPISEAEDIMKRAAEPKRLTVIDASNHRFSSNIDEFDRRLLEAFQWIENLRPSVP
jgi:alpha-beta hydrolase superfamily lysophospholipase